MERPFSQASENNKAPILSVIKKHFAQIDFVLEVGSGTGQHAVYFAEQLPHLVWQPTDQQQYIDGIRLWLQSASLKNIHEPLVLNVNQRWPVNTAPAIFTANTLHIMSWQEVEYFFRTVKNVLNTEGTLCVYGPFNYKGAHTSESNARFDQWLKQRDPLSGIRDFEAVHSLAESSGLQLTDDYAMPANNRCLIFCKE